MRIKIFLLFALAGFCAANPVAARSRFVVLSAHHGFSIPHIRRVALHADRHFAAVSVLGAYDTSLNDALGPDDSTGALPPPLPYPPAVYYPAAYAPPHCVRPKIIYLTDEKPVAVPVRIIYGTAPPQCSE